MTVQRKTILPAAREVVFERLQQLKTLQFIASPYATFEPVGDAFSTWNEGKEFSLTFKLFGLIPFGIHTIRIVRFEPDGISSREGNRHVPTWNHNIILVKLDGSHTGYTDRVEIKAGWKTFFVWIWANAFYAHRQRRWRRLLSSDDR